METRILEHGSQMDLGIQLLEIVDEIGVPKDPWNSFRCLHFITEHNDEPLWIFSISNLESLHLSQHSISIPISKTPLFN